MFQKVGARNDLQKGVMGCGKINETATGSVQEKREGGFMESISNGDREKLTDLNDIPEVNLTGFSVTGVEERGNNQRWL